MAFDIFRDVQSNNFLAAGNDERREHSRYERETYLIIQPLDENLDPVGNELSGMSVDTSLSGIGLWCVDDIETRMVRVTICEDNSSRIGIIRHGRLVHAASQKFFYGIEYLQ